MCRSAAGGSGTQWSAGDLTTRGEKGVQDEAKWPADQLGDIRQRELEAALHLLGITEHLWLGYRDGECKTASHEEAARRITDVIERRLVDTVLTFGPDGLTGHPDHKAVSRWVDAAVHASSRRPRVYHIAQLRSCYERYLRPADQKLHIFFGTKRPRVFDPDECAICLKPEAKSIAQKFRALRAMPSQMTTLLQAIPPSDFVSALGTEAFVEPKAARRR